MAPTRRDIFRLAAGIAGFTMIGEGRAIKPVAAADDASTDLWASITRYLDLFRTLPADYQQRRIDTVWAYAESVADDRQTHAVISDLAIHLEAIASPPEPVHLNMFSVICDEREDRLFNREVRIETDAQGASTTLSVTGIDIGPKVFPAGPVVARHYREVYGGLQSQQEELVRKGIVR